MKIGKDFGKADFGKAEEFEPLHFIEHFFASRSIFSQL